MDWMWVETKREQATSLPRFWPEQWKEGLAIRQNKKSVLQQTLFLSLLKNYHLPEEGFADSSPIITPSVQNCNSTAVMYICLCTLALWRVKPLQYLRVFVPPPPNSPSLGEMVPNSPSVGEMVPPWRMHVLEQVG